ncbi:2-amino-4-hydroxy-6-hydroxymethyldihydropteridine diphosphokinase [Sedimentitalea sp. HM32M-2]|uniref:2-amino-4-hydroxy-6- hydroxymethyldihydropteridine diphosphokinase n=1 Tax=Sedimentitalea sp. HM32M-2 TaxID=3351566 RepID=UPI0036321BE0
MIEFRSDIAIGLGGNLPFSDFPVETTLMQAIQALAESGLVIRAVSRFFRTPCFPAGAGPDYVNAAVAIGAGTPPEQILHRLHDIESRFGRARDTRWGMRTLDLDLLLHGDTIHPDRAGFAHWLNLPPAEQRRAAPQRLILPHPRLQDRAFVLVPLADILPDWRHPVLGRTVRQLCADLPAGERDAIRPL